MRNLGGKKGQVSTELMVVVGVILILFIPLIVAMYFKTNEINSSLEISQAQLAVSRLASLSNSMGNLGKESYIRADIYVPSTVTSISFKSFSAGGGEVVFKVKSPGGGESDVVESTKYPLAGATIVKPTPGLSTFDLTSDGAAIQIRKI